MFRISSTVAGPSLVGRAHELAALRDRLDGAAAGRGSASLIVGEAGIGKSRLAREVAADAMARGWVVAEGHCIAVGSEPLRRAALLGILRSTGASRAAASTEELLEGVLAVVDGASASSPLLVLVEDVHWADRATCEVLMVLARHVTGRPAWLVMTSRDDELPRGHQVRGFLAELRRAQLVATVPLLPLGAADVATLIQNLVGPADLGRASTVFDRSGGNPLLVEELCDASATGTFDVGLEDRFVDVLLARADQLSSGAMRIASAVAAAGRFVDETVLAEVVAMDAGRADGWFAAGLHEALDHHLLVRDDDAVGFRHVLMAEAVHARMLLAERVALHARWADVLARSDEDPAVLAHHWAEAHNAELALSASVAAGDAAVRAVAPDAAIAHYRRALALWDDVADPSAAAGRSRTQLCAEAAEAANWSGEPGEAAELVSLALAGPSPADPVTTSRLLERKGWYLLRQGHTEAAQAPYRAAVETLPDDAPPADRARVLAGSVRIWERLRDPERALATARVAVAAASESGATDAETGQARYMLGRALLASGQTESALGELAAAAASAERCLDAVSLSIALLDRADVLATLERCDEACDDALAAADRLRARGFSDPHALLCVGVAAGLLHRMGLVERARELVDGLVVEARTPVTLALGHLLTGMLDVDALALGDAREHLEVARFLSAPLLDGRIAGNLAWGRSELALAEGRLEDARAAVEEGIAQVECTGDEEMLCELCLLGLRIAADRAAGGDPRRSARAKARDAAAIARYERLLAPRAAGTTEDPRVDEQAMAGAVGAAWQAERSRLDGASDPASWAAATEQWAAVGRPRSAVLARIRRAEALQARPVTRPEAVAVLQQALKESESIGSQLLAQQARTVARRAGIVLTTSGGEHSGEQRPPADGVAAPLASLTRREREVLDLVAGGSTNRQIGAVLYISSKTASVHVSSILAKLEVSTRGEAAAVARRAGLRPHRTMQGAE